MAEKDKNLIVLAAGTGAGPTPLAAFDAALINIGIANYNLILLSSVIPPHSEIVQAEFLPPADEYGDRLYVVMAEQQICNPGASAWAGLGWVQNIDDGYGLFVEIKGSSQEEVESEIEATLKAMVQNRPEFNYGPIHSKIIGITCQGQPVCAMVAAVYKSERW